MLFRSPLVSAGAMRLDRLGPPGLRFTDFRPALTLSVTLTAREGADGQAVVCRLLRGSSPTRGVAPKRQNKAIADQSPLLKLVYEESDSKERLRVSNWIVQRLYDYAVKKTVEL